MDENEKKALRDELLGEVKGVVAELVKPIADAQKVIVDTMAADKEAAKTAAAASVVDPKPAADAKPLTAEQITAMVNEKAAAMVEEKFKVQQTSSEKAAARIAFVADKMKDLPPLYQSQLKGDDVEQWKVQEQAIRTQAKADAAAMGFVVKDVGGNPAGQGAGTGGQGGVANNFNGALTDGQAKYAAGLVLPGAAK